MSQPEQAHDDRWELSDAVEMHRQNPGTFWIPDAAESEALKTGDLAKLRFLVPAFDEETGEQYLAGERMWVIVEGREGNHYRGRLDNDSFSLDTLVSGTTVFFEARHVIDIMRGLTH